MTATADTKDGEDLVLSSEELKAYLRAFAKGAGNGEGLAAYGDDELNACQRALSRHTFDFVREITPKERQGVLNFLSHRIADTKINRNAPAPPGPVPWSADMSERVLQGLFDDGIAMIGPYLSHEQVAAIHTQLAAFPVFNGHLISATDRIPRYLDRPEDEAASYQFGCYRPSDILKIETLRDIAFSAPLLSLAERYLGVPPRAHIQLWWTFPGRHPKVGPQPYAGLMYHRDYASFRDMQFFIPLTDLKPDEGPHYYIRGTHDVRRLEANLGEGVTGPEGMDRNTLIEKTMRPENDGYGVDPFLEEAYADTLRLQVCAPAGTAFIEDGNGLHKGKPPHEKPRLMFSVRYFASVGAAGAVFMGQEMPYEDFVRHELDSGIAVEPADEQLT